MTTYASDSSEDEERFQETGVLLGYATKEPIDDPTNQLGGHPSWLERDQPPLARLGRCKICNDLMSLLLQLNGDMPEHFLRHERRLYIFSCRRRTCRRKEGSVRGVRACRVSKEQREKVWKADRQQQPESSEEESSKRPRQGIGESLFGVESPKYLANSANPFSTASASNSFSPASPSTSLNLFATSSLATTPAQKPTPDVLSETFASKARISSPPATSQPRKSAHESWPPQDSFPAPYPAYYLDAEYETLDKPSSHPIPSQTTMDVDSAEGTDPFPLAKEDKEAFESTLDKTFQRFADRLAENPEQVIRYEFRGTPLLYSKSDAVGRLLALRQGQGGEGRVTMAGRGGSGMPRCAECGGERVFEVQLTPHAITELEVKEVGLEGMDWGTVILGVCAADCLPRGTKVGEVGYAEEWVGVQWEEIAPKRAPI